MLLKGLKRFVHSIIKRTVREPSKSWRGGYLGDNRYLTVTEHGHKIFLDTRDMTVAPHIIIDGSWEPWVTNCVIATVEDGMRAIEIGSNLGWYTLLIARQVGINGKLIAFEANKHLCQLTFDSVCINGYVPIVDLHNCVVSDSVGETDFHIRERHLGNSSLGKVSQNHLDKLSDGQVPIKMPMVSLDQFLTAENRKVDFMKVDAEGAESRIFQGMKALLQENSDIRIVMEYSPSQLRSVGSDPYEMMEFLYGLGFHSYRIEFDGSFSELTIEKLSDENYDMLLTRRKLTGRG